MTDFFPTNSEEFAGNEDLLSAYVDGELSAADRARVESRLAESAQWRTVLEETISVRSALRNLPERDAPPEFWVRLTTTVTNDTVVIAMPKARRRQRWLAAVGGAAVAAALVIGIVVIPKTDKARPPLGIFINRHAVQASNGGAPIVDLARVATQNRFSR